MAGGMFGYRPNDILMQGLMAQARAPVPQGSIQNYRPTLGERVTEYARNKLLGAGATRTMARRAANLVDYSPIGAAATALQTGMDLRAGNYRYAALNGVTSALNAVPDAGPVAKAMFVGVMAKNADKVALRKAEEMAAKGKHPWDILDDTGWFKGVDGKWRTELDDSAAKLTGKTSGKLPDVLDHPELYQAYPDLAKIGVFPTARTGGAYERAFVDGSPIPGMVWLGSKGAPAHQRSVALHEVQHAIQDIEGFAGGGAFSNMPKEEYKRLAGEVEARNVQTRLGLNAQQRLDHPFWLTQDTPSDQQIVRFLGHHVR